MENHGAELPKKIEIGPGVINNIVDICKELGLKNPLVVADPVTRNIAGDKVKDLLLADIVIIESSTMEEVEKVETGGGDCIISTGGGKAIDVGKLAAYKLGVPFISIPTAPSHDGLVSDTAIITTDGKYQSYKVKPPIAVVFDTNIIKNAPYRLIAAGAADIISNYSSIFDWRLGRDNVGEEYNKEIADLALKAADLVAESVDEIKNKSETGLRNLTKAIMNSSKAMLLAGSSRPASGAEHMFSHALDKIGPFGLHGEQCGIGSIIIAYWQGQDWGKIKLLLKNVGAPTTAKELNIPEDKVIEALLIAKDIRKRYTILDVKPFTKEKALEACRAVGVF